MLISVFSFCFFRFLCYNRTKSRRRAGSLRIYKLDDRHFIAKFKAAPQGVIYWTMQYLSQVEIIEPEHMRQKAIEFIKSNPYGITAEPERS